MDQTYKIYTIGHSTHSTEKLVDLLSKHSINVVCDVRSTPYSQFNPQFNRETIQKELKKNKISYIFLGKELGPRSEDPNCYVDGKIQYNHIAATENFEGGLNRLRNGLKDHRIALMCAEKDPIMCHRTILVCRHLRSYEVKIYHILEDGSLEKNEDSERRLMRMLKIPELTLFEKPDELIERAYDTQGEKIAFEIDEDLSNSI